MSELHTHSMITIRKMLDYIGATLGVICAVHCMITPVAIMVLPSLGLGLGVLWTEEGEEALLIGLLCFACLSGVISVWRSQAWRILIGFLISLMLLFTAHLIGHESMWSLPISLTGGFGLISCHLWSIRQQQLCCQEVER